MRSVGDGLVKPEMSQFAKGTNHEAIAPQCLSSEEIKDRVGAFGEKTGFVGETQAARVGRVKQEKGASWEPRDMVTVKQANGLTVQLPMPLRGTNI